MLSERALNRALLARQLYLDRSDLSIPQALDRIAGIQNQYAPAGYISLWSRLTGFRRDQLTSALERGEVVQGTTIRSTIHLVTPELFHLSNAAVREERTAWWFRATGRHDQLEMQRVAKEIEAALRKGPQSRSLLMKELGIDSATWNGAVNYLDLIRVPGKSENSIEFPGANCALLRYSEYLERPVATGSAGGDGMRGSGGRAGGPGGMATAGRRAQTPAARSVSSIRTATTIPEPNVIAATTHIAPFRPNASAVNPARTAPTAYPRSRHNR